MIRVPARVRTGATASAVVLLLLTACGEDPKAAPPPAAVGYVTLQTEPVTLTAELAGRTAAVSVSEVRPQVNGLVRRRLFEEGAWVRAGQPLYEIDASLYRASRNEAEARLASARAQLATAEAEAARYEGLTEIDAVSQQAADNVIAAARQARAAVAQQEAALRTADITLGFTRITAPISGRIGRSLVTQGALVTASQAEPLAVIQALDPMYVDITESSARILELRRLLAGGGLSAASASVVLILEDGSEYPQAGIEDLGDADRAAADGRTIADALGVLADCGIDLTRVETTVGDQALFEQFLSSLGLPSGWQRRLIRTFGHDTLLRQALESLATGGSRASIETLSPDLYELALARDVARLSDNIRDRMEEGGLPLHRGRTPAEIAGRLIEKVAVAETRLDRTVLERLRAFLSIDCPLDRSVDALEMLCRESGTDLGHSLDAFKARGEALAQAGVDLARPRYRAAFGRALDYYTGMVFEISAEGQDGPLVGGGRYDKLVSYLGAPETIPAVGFALWPGRMASVGSRVPA